MTVIDKSVKVLQADEQFPDLEIRADAIRDTIQRKKLANGSFAVGFLARDEDCRNPLEDCEGMGKIQSFERCDKMNSKADHAPYGVQLSLYRHSGDTWSIRGEGPQCQWDTINLAGLWYPDEACKEHIDSIAQGNPAWIKRESEICARQALQVFNQWIAGECYGVCVQTFGPDGKELDDDSCWGFVGIEYASKELAEWLEARK